LEGAAPMLQAIDMDDAVGQANQQATTGSIVLLAPACASFDMFKNYEHRGKAFKEAVFRLKAAH
jgi:UDP-N-acetylmuramoylalanine--D-glutamate ligase